YRGIRTVELGASTVAINGQTVGRDVARSWLGEHAEEVDRLLEMPPEERLESLGVAGPPEGLPETAAAEEEEQAEVGEGARSATEGRERAEDEGPEAAERPEEPERPEQAEGPEAPEPPEEPEPPEAPEPPEEPRIRRGSQTVVGSHVHVAADEVVDGVLVFGGSATVDGRVNGDVMVVGGTVRVDGEVRADVTVVGGSIRLGPEAEVGGDATAVGGSVTRSTGAEVGGRIEEVREGWGPWWPGLFWNWDAGRHWSPWNWVWDLTWPLAELMLLALLVALIIAVGRDTVERVGARAAAAPARAGVTGLLVAILTLPVLIIVITLLAISIIGIPILVVLVLLFVFVGIPGLLVMALVGYSGVALRLGRWSEGRFGWRLPGPYLAALVGLLLLHLLELVGSLLDFGPVSVFGTMFLLAGGIVQFVAWFVGFGAVCLLLYERRARRRAARNAGTPLPPPHQDQPPPPSPPPEERGG
ncbi:MAG: hypothetical protein ACLF0P_14005, partial [Thermoanaerobaculia bacterium]